MLGYALSLLAARCRSWPRVVAAERWLRIAFPCAFDYWPVAGVLPNQNQAGNRLKGTKLHGKIE